MNKNERILKQLYMISEKIQALIIKFQNPNLLLLIMGRIEIKTSTFLFRLYI